MANKSGKPSAHHCHGVVRTIVVGPRGQIVIPKEAREWMGIKPGDQLVLLSKVPGAMMILRADGIRHLAEKIMNKIGV